MRGMESTLLEVRGLAVITFGDVQGGASSFSMRFVHLGTRRDHRMVRLFGTDVDERMLQEAVYDFCDRVQIQQTEHGSLRLEFWRGDVLAGSHRVESFNVESG